MNKKLIAVAVASAFGIPSLALAQFSVPDGVAGSSAAGSSVTISGKLNYIYGQYANGGQGNSLQTTNTAALTAGTANLLSGHSALANSESQVDIKGSEALGGGRLKRITLTTVGILAVDVIQLAADGDRATRSAGTSNTVRH